MIAPALENIQKFKAVTGMENSGMVTINQDGSAEFTTGKDTIPIVVMKQEDAVATNTPNTETQPSSAQSTEIGINTITPPSSTPSTEVEMNTETQPSSI